MKYTTETGVGYFQDEQGRVVDRYDVPPGEHEAGAPRVRAIDVESMDDLPPTDPHYQR